MSNSRILNDPRKLSNDELVQLNMAQQKWYPAIFQTYNTSIFDMMASPYKKGLLQGVVILVIVLIILGFNRVFNFIPFPNLVIGIFTVVIVLFVSISSGISQYKTNDNLQLFLTLTKPNATKYDYESSPIIRDKLMRNAYRGGSDSGSSGLLGGLVGFGLGSSAGSSKSRRGGFGRRQ